MVREDEPLPRSVAKCRGVPEDNRRMTARMQESIYEWRIWRLNEIDDHEQMGVTSHSRLFHKRLRIVPHRINSLGEGCEALATLKFSWKIAATKREVNKMVTATQAEIVLINPPAALSSPIIPCSCGKQDGAHPGYLASSTRKNVKPEISVDNPFS